MAFLYQKTNKYYTNEVFKWFRLWNTIELTTLNVVPICSIEAERVELAVRERTSQSDPNGAVYVLSCSCTGHLDRGYVEIRVRMRGGDAVVDN